MLSTVVPLAPPVTWTYTYAEIPAPDGIKPVGMTFTCKNHTELAPSRLVTRVTGNVYFPLVVSKAEPAVLVMVLP